MKKNIMTICALFMGLLAFQSCNLLGWEDDHVVDKRIDRVVPEDVRDKMEDWMPIYDGILPPVVEGVYAINPMTTIHCEDYPSGGYSPGRVMSYPHHVRFYNQNRLLNTIDMEEQEGLSYSSGTGCFISGSGNNFTVYFNTVGQSHGIDTKTALVISGTKTEGGISDIYYAFVMVDKGDDPSNLLMAEGVYRVFNDGDGLAEATSWPTSVEILESGRAGSLDELNQKLFHSTTQQR
jgi:hypothetical protein